VTLTCVLKSQTLQDANHSALVITVLTQAHVLKHATGHAESGSMKEYFTFDNLPLTIIVGLIAWSWLVTFIVILS
jgi:hypothetical protein